MASLRVELRKISHCLRLLQNKYLLFSLAYAFTIFFLARYFAEAYMHYSFSNIPIGWDTPWYIRRIDLAKSGYFLEVIHSCRFTNFLYPLFVSMLPLDAFLIETYVPIVLAFLIPIVSYFFTTKTSSYNGWIVIISSSIWYAIYRLSADLHANLLGVALSLAFSALLISISSFTKKIGIFVTLLISISSFVHFETTLFFLLISLMTLVAQRRTQQDSRKHIVILLISVIPALLPYVHTQFSRLQTEGVIATGNRIIYNETFVNSVGIYLIPLTIAGLLFLYFKDRKTRFDVFILCWSSLSLSLVSLNILTPISNFAERALVIFPTPFLLVPLIDFFVKKSLSKKSKAKLPSVFLISFVLTTIISANSIMYYSLNNHPKVFISKDIYEELMFLKRESERNDTDMIFIYDLNNPGIVELYDNWVSAIIGDHLSYYGNIFDLLQMKQGYDNLISRRFYNHLKEKQPLDIFRFDLIFLKQFYTDESIFAYINEEELTANVRRCNLTSLQSQPDITIAVKNLNYSSFGNWYINEMYNAIEIYGNETQEPYLLLNLSLPVGFYDFSLTYWDGAKGNGLRIFINDELHSSLNYNASSAFQPYLIANMSFSNNTNVVKILVFKTHIYHYFARLGSITITPNPFRIHNELQR